MKVFKYVTLILLLMFIATFMYKAYINTDVLAFGIGVITIPLSIMFYKMSDDV